MLKAYLAELGEEMANTKAAINVCSKVVTGCDYWNQIDCEAKTKGRTLSCHSFQWDLQAYLSLCLCMQSSDFTGAQMLRETFLEPLELVVDVV